MGPVQILIREFGSIEKALEYAERVSRMNGPLDAEYAEYARALRMMVPKGANE